MGKSIEEIILERLEQFFDGEKLYDWAYEDFDVDELGLGPVEVVDNGGGPDKGYDWFKVYHFVEKDVYLKTEGWYSSYSGLDFDKGIGKFVKPKVKTIRTFQ